MHAEPIDRQPRPREASQTPAAARVAVVIPCLNEAAAVGAVVRDFQTALPEARIFVFDNGSTDGTAEAARAAGALVRTEPKPGKGNVVRRMFADVEADVYVLVDGDATYDAAAAPSMVSLLMQQGLDMVVGARQDEVEAAYRSGHRFGNALLTGFLDRVFGGGFKDLLSGYRVLSRRFVKTFPCLSSGFEIETEMAVHAITVGLPFAEAPTVYVARPSGSESKLNTVRDGVRILKTMITLLRQEKPMPFFGAIGAALAALSLILAWPLAVTYLRTGLVPRFPTAILCTGLMILALLNLASGVILDATTRARLEMRRLAYLSWRAPERE